tara:strand:- start:540 stop:821 length:282 start_codon:yes stop_codon:yes gene_type:complete
MTNKEIIEKYLNNENARNNNLRSIDNKLYSYDLKISEIKYHKIILFDYDINTIEQITGYRSLTTRQHLGILKRALKNDVKKVIINNIYSYSKI